MNFCGHHCPLNCGQRCPCSTINKLVPIFKYPIGHLIRFDYNWLPHVSADFDFHEETSAFNHFILHKL